MWFTGTGFKWITIKGPDCGIARITVDGVPMAPVDLYSGAFQWQQAVYTSPVLSPGLHKVKIEWTGDKNDLSTGTFIGLDAFDVTGSLAQAAADTSRFEESDTRIVLDGTWSVLNNAKLSATRYVYSRATDDAMNISFKGTRFDWFTVKGPDCGKARVVLDGEATATVDLYSDAYAWQRKVWTVTGLEDTTHTIRIEVLGDKNGSSTGYAVGLDAVDVLGTLVQAVSSLPPTTRYEQNVDGLVYTGVWNTVSGVKFSGGNYAATNATGTVSFTFLGTRASLTTLKGPDCGIARITVDGVASPPVDLYSSAYLYNAKVWTSSLLTDGPHTVTISWTGDKNAASTKAFVGVDAIDIQGALVP
jgi:hypothetical protein